MSIDQALEDAASLQSLIDAAAEPEATPSGKARSAAISAAITEGDLDELMSIQERLGGMVAQILENKIDVENLGQLDDAQLLSTMKELLDQKDIKRLIEVRYDMIRSAVFAHITETNRAMGVPDPEHSPGEAPVQPLGKKFVREGGRIKAHLNHALLREKLGEKVWEQVCKAEVVPAVPEHIEYHLDEDALLKMVVNNPHLLQVFKKCVTTGGASPARLMIRDIKK